MNYSWHLNAKSPWKEWPSGWLPAGRAEQEADIPAQTLRARALPESSERPVLWQCSDIRLRSVSSSVWERAGARPPETLGTNFAFHFVNWTLCFCSFCPDGETDWRRKKNNAFQEGLQQRLGFLWILDHALGDTLGLPRAAFPFTLLLSDFLYWQRPLFLAWCAVLRILAATSNRQKELEE